MRTPRLPTAAGDDALTQLAQVSDVAAVDDVAVLPTIVEALPTVAPEPADALRSEPVVDAQAFAVAITPAVAEPDIEPVPTVAPPIVAPVRPPVAATPGPRPPLLFRSRPRVRRVTRVVRHIDTWSVFKVALVFNAVLYLVCLTAGVLLWNVAHATGTIDNVEQFFEQFGWSSFEFNGGQIYHNAWIAGLFVAVGLTGFAVLLATLFNLITDLVGGVRVSVLEEEVVARRAPSGPPDGTAATPAPADPS